MKVSKKILAGALILVIALIITACAGGPMRAATQDLGPSAEANTVLTRAPLSVTINAIGNVRSAQSAVLTWQTSGKVGQVNVAVGEKVDQDQVMATFDPTSLSSSILQAQVDLINAENALEDLYETDPFALAQAEDELELAKEALDTLRNPSESDISNAELAIITAQDEIDDAEKDLNGLLNGRGNDRLIREARANYLIAQDKLDEVEKMYQRVRGDPEKDASKAQALSTLEGAKRDRDRTLASLNWYLGEPTEQELAEAEAKLAVAQAKLADAEQFLVDLQNPSDSAISLAEARITDIEENIQQLLSGPTEDDLTIAQTRITQAQANLEQTFISAPFEGTVTEIQVLKGDLVSPGQQAFRIDDLSTYYLDLDVSEIDISQIQVGFPVRLVFDALPDQEYEGEVDSIGQVGNSIQNVVNFVVTVRLTNPDASIKTGMTAEANIQIAEVDDVLQLPNRFIFEDDGKRYVYRVNGEELERVFVQVGISSDSACEIISENLKEGDEVTSQPGIFAQFGGGPPSGMQR